LELLVAYPLPSIRLAPPAELLVAYPLPSIRLAPPAELLVAYPRPSIRLAPPAECQRFISYQSERYTSRGLLSPFYFADCLSTKDV
jgi:hypothetical protein